MEPFPCPRCDGSIPTTVDPGDSCPHCGGSLVVCGRFHIDELLGAGGMSKVYGGTRRPDGHPVAIKVVRLADHDDFTPLDLATRSLRVLKRLDHPLLPTIHGSEQDAEGRLFVVRDRYEGGTLQARIDEGRRLDAQGVEELLRALLGLLDYLQSRDDPIIHRDIKPANIMFTSKERWEPHLVDFDTVAVAESGGLTMVGTAGYAPPEQLAGAPEPASDLYALGATMVFAATHLEPREIPKQGGKLAIDGPLEEAGVGARLRAVVGHLLEPTLERRVATAREALDELEGRQLVQADWELELPWLQSAVTRIKERLVTPMYFLVIAAYVPYFVLLELIDGFSYLETAYGEWIIYVIPLPFLAIPYLATLVSYWRRANRRTLRLGGGTLTVLDGRGRPRFSGPKAEVGAAFVTGHGLSTRGKRFVRMQGGTLPELTIGTRSGHDGDTPAAASTWERYRQMLFWPRFYVEDHHWKELVERLEITDERGDADR